MTNIIEISSLIPMEYANREKFFLNENNEIQPIIDIVKKHYSSIVFEGIDGKTEAGRKAIKKIAAELKKKIDEIDNAGKEFASILKAKPKLIDATRKKIRDDLGALYEEIRRPVVEYEAEQNRIKAEEEARIEAQRRAEQEELERLRAEKEQRDREFQVAQEAAAQAKLEADNRVKEAELALQREREENARKEQERQAEIQKLKEDEERRNTDVEHKRSINRKVITDFCNSGIAEEIAITVLKLIVGNKISNITINY